MFSQCFNSFNFNITSSTEETSKGTSVEAEATGDRNIPK
jgi:hypothetical protein